MAASLSSPFVALGNAGPLHTAGDDVDSWPAAKTIRSTMTDEHRLRKTCASYELPKEYTVLCARDRPPCTPPPEGSNIVCIYEGMLQAGIRFPLHGFYAKILRHYNLAPSQLSPNAWRFLAGFVMLCESLSIEPTKAVFRHFFKLRAHSSGDHQGWYYFMPHSSKRSLFKSIDMLPKNEDGWKKKFFFLDSGSSTPWRCPKKWGTPSAAAYDSPVLTAGAREEIRKLEEATQDTDHLDGVLRAPENLPVLRPDLPLPVKTEERWGPRKRMLLDNGDISATPSTQQSVGVGEPSSTQPDLSTGELSQLVSRLVQKAEIDLYQAKQQLLEKTEQHRAEVAQLKNDLDAAREKHAADVAQLNNKLEAEKAKFAHKLQEAEARHFKTFELMKAEQTKVEALGAERKVLWAAQAQRTAQLKAAQDQAAKAHQLTDLLRAEAARMKEQLEALKAQHAAAGMKEQPEALKSQHAEELKAIQVECQNRLIKAERMSNAMLKEKYEAGLRDMKKLVLLHYPNVVDGSLLTPEAAEAEQ